MSPSGGYAIPAQALPGLYKLCAKVNADDALTETSSVDNIVRSEKDFEVLSCP